MKAKPATLAKKPTPAQTAPPSKAMTVHRRHEPGPVRSPALFRRQMDDLFEDFFGLRPWGDEEQFERFTPVISPNFEVTESEDGFRVAAELPGMDEKDVEVSLEENRLTVRGEKREETEEKKRNYHFTERSYGTFQRSFTLPGTVNAGKITAEFKKGVLRITLPKTAEAKVGKRRIAVTGD
ncbi:MAG: Hsp20/alpha crystallin family protein [Lentisphaeria bacterium]